MTNSLGDYGANRAGVSDDVLVVGDGVIGLSIALELARCGAKVTVLGRAQQGAASWASGGLLAPSTGPLPRQAADFFYGSLAAFPEFVQRLWTYADGLGVITGLIELGRTAGDAELDRAELSRLEPALPWRPGAVLHARDGAVDARRLLEALRAAVRDSRRVSLRDGTAVALESGAVITDAGDRLASQRIVLSAGAWTSQIRGLPRPLPVRPLKGQMIALGACPLKHPVLAGHTYLVPRSAMTIAGSTSEDTGFVSETDAPTTTRLVELAREICPDLANAPVVDAWAGLRPMTPDRLPIICEDPDVRGLFYACGHSRNGILLAPATAGAVADLVVGAIPRYDLTPFAVQRFALGSGTERGQLSSRTERSD